MRKPHLDPLAVSILLACCFFWGFQQVLIKATMAELAPMFQASLRLAGATLLLWLWCRWRGVKLWEPDGSAKAGLLAGGLFAAEFACIYLGLQATSASRLTVFLYTSPFWVALLVPLWVRSERLRGVQWLGLVAAFGCVVCPARRLDRRRRQHAARRLAGPGRRDAVGLDHGGDPQFGTGTNLG